MSYHWGTDFAASSIFAMTPTPTVPTQPLPLMVDLNPAIQIVNPSGWPASFLTLLAGIFGALITGYALTRNERVRRSEDRVDRDRSQIVNLVSNFLTETHQTIEQSISENYSDLSLMTSYSTMTQLQILAPASVGDSAERLHSAMNTLIFSPPDTEQSKPKTAASAAFGLERADFIRLVRSIYNQNFQVSAEKALAVTNLPHNASSAPDKRPGV